MWYEKGAQLRLMHKLILKRIMGRVCSENCSFFSIEYTVNICSAVELLVCISCSSSLSIQALINHCSHCLQIDGSSIFQPLLREMHFIFRMQQMDCIIFFACGLWKTNNSQWSTYSHSYRGERA